MPGHIFLQTGDYDLAAKTNVKASAADRAFVERTGATGMYPLMYWTHNMHFIAYARAQQGRYDEAKQAALDMVENVGDADLGNADARRFPPLSADGGPALPALGRDSQDAGATAGAQAAARVLAVRKAMALAGQGRLNDAAAGQKQFEALRRAMPAESQYLINNKASDCWPWPRPRSTPSSPGRAGNRGSRFWSGAARSSLSRRSSTTSRRRGSTR